MTPDRWRAVKSVLNSAIGLPPEEREAFLQREVSGEAMREEVRSLIASYEADPLFAETPAAVLVGEEPTAQRMPQSIEQYEIVSRLGSGGMGEVYLAIDTRLGRNVALKVLPVELTNDPDRVGRLEQEARAASALNHPNIVTVYELGRAGSSRFIAEEYVEGVTLRDKLRSGPMPLDQVLDIALQVTAALHAAHSAGIIHRDIKPENIMIRRDGLVKVLDFGLAKFLAAAARPQLQTSAGVILGTVQYMSPEQARGTDVDARTDLWSLGVVIYEMVAQRRPFEAPTASDAIARILQADPPPLDGIAPPALQRILTTALAKDRKSRYESAALLSTEIKALQQNGSSVAAKPRRRRLAVVAALLVFIIVAATSLLLVRLHVRSPVLPEVTNSRAVLPAVNDRGNAEGAARPVLRSVAVLNFVNMSGSAENDYLSEGMSEEISSALAQIRDLKVVSRTSVFALEGRALDVKQLGEKLGVAAVVEGSFRKAGNRVRATARLVNVANGYQLWTESYDGKLTDIFSMQDRIAAAVSAALESENRPRVRQRTADLTAYELYLKGRQASAIWTSSSYEKAVSYYRGAIARDPKFSDAWAGLGDLYSMMDHRPGLTTLPAEETYRLATAAAKRSIELDPQSGEAEAALGHILVHEGDFEAARRHLLRAIQLNPNSSGAHTWNAMLLRAERRFPEMKQEFFRARELDPFSVLNARLGGYSLWVGGDFDAALQWTRLALETAPDVGDLHLNLARSYALMGRKEEADEEIRLAAAGPYPSTAVDEEGAFTLAMAGRHDQALARVRAAEKKKHPHVPALLRTYAALGDIDRACYWAQWFVRETPRLARINMDLPPHPAFASFVSSPCYRQARRDLGLGDVN
jgi:serine/threonine protein kinase/tetratricopeptide (TPR) repeat protein